MPSDEDRACVSGVSNGATEFAIHAAMYSQAPPETIPVAAGMHRTSQCIGAIFTR